VEEPEEQEQIQDLSPGCLVVIRGGGYSREALEGLKVAIEKHAGFSVLVVQTAPGVTLETLPRKDALRLLKAICKHGAEGLL